MKKYEIRTSEPSLSKERIEQHKNFNALLTAANTLKSNRLKKFRLVKGGIVVTLILLCLGLGYYYTQPSFLQLTEDNKRARLTSSIDSTEVRSHPLPKEADPAEPLKKEVEARQKIVEERKNEQKVETPVQKKERKGNKPSPASERGTKDHTGQKEEESFPQITTAGDELAYQEATPREGMEELKDFLKRELVYPKMELMKGVEGTVILSMTINEQGRAQEIQVVQSVSEAIDAEAIRLVKNMPPWNPGQLNGKAVSSRVSLPIIFKITASDE